MAAKKSVPDILIVEALRRAGRAGRHGIADELDRLMPKKRASARTRPNKTPLNATRASVDERIRQAFKAYGDVVISPCPDEDAIEIEAVTASKLIRVSVIVTTDRDDNIVLQSVRCTEWFL